MSANQPTANITGGIGGMGIAAARLMGRDHRIVLADLDRAERPECGARGGRRTARLLEEGIVRINTLVSPFLSEQRVMALIGIRVKGNLPLVISHLQDVLAIGLIAVVTGRNNLLLEVTCSSRNDLVKFLDSKLVPIPEVIGFEVNQYLSVQKLPPNGPRSLPTQTPRNSRPFWGLRQPQGKEDSLAAPAQMLSWANSKTHFTPCCGK